MTYGTETSRFHEKRLGIADLSSSQPRAGIEVKSSSAPSLGKGFYSAIADLQTKKKLRHCPRLGGHLYPRKPLDHGAELKPFLDKHIGRFLGWSGVRRWGGGCCLGVLAVILT